MDREELIRLLKAALEIAEGTSQEELNDDFGFATEKTDGYFFLWHDLEVMVQKTF